MDQIFKTIIESIEFDENSKHVTIRFGPSGKLPVVMTLLNKYGSNNTKSFRITNQRTDNATAILTKTYRTSTGTTQLLRDYELNRQTDQETNIVETNKPTNNLETDNNTDTSKNSTDSNATDSTDSSENSDDTDSTDNSDDPDNNDINNDDRIATNENTDSNDNNDAQRPANNDDIEACTINEPNIALRHTYNPQDIVQLLKINLTDAYTVTATYIGTTIDAEALFRQHGPCNTEHHATKDKDIKAIIIRYQMKNHALKVINKYKEHIQQTNDDIQRPTTEQQTNKEKTIEYVQTPNTICVRVPGHTTRQNLTETFQQFGNIIDVRHLEPKDGQNGRYTTFIQFENQDSADKAVEKTQMTHSTRLAYNKVYTSTQSTAQQKTEKEQNTTQQKQKSTNWSSDSGNNTKLYILAPPDITKQQLETDFTVFGETVSIELTDSTTKRKVGYITYTNKVDAIDAKLNGPQKYIVKWKWTPRTDKTMIHFLCGDQIPKQSFDNHIQNCNMPHLRQRILNEKSTSTTKTQEDPRQTTSIPQPSTSEQAKEQATTRSTTSNTTTPVSVHKVLHLDYTSSSDEDPIEREIARQHARRRIQERQQRAEQPRRQHTETQRPTRASTAAEEQIRKEMEKIDFNNILDTSF
ncbi:bromodomain-containing protein DDB_G0280777-like [Nasonia vitripennis]|uniref:RRM domain-containing protein n=1 Tax=Nasonia vitripennis TaxID=7425 RepID=A0A7M7T945_NASVI|nr:bromodomain-containing protein DDB_G0280777-like [Nasonia vitripennis]